MSACYWRGRPEVHGILHVLLYSGPMWLNRLLLMMFICVSRRCICRFTFCVTHTYMKLAIRLRHLFSLRYKKFSLLYGPSNTVYSIYASLHFLAGSMHQGPRDSFSCPPWGDFQKLESRGLKLPRSSSLAAFTSPIHRINHLPMPFLMAWVIQKTFTWLQTSVHHR